LFAVGNTSFSLPTGAGSTEADCIIQDQMNVFSLGGHMHEWGKHAMISLTKVGAAEQVLWDYAWSDEYQFNPPRNAYTTEAPLVLAPGDKLHIECSYENNTGGPLPFPREMCIAFSYAYPMTKQINCLDGSWPND
jgi:hypothetical protein